MQLMHVFVPDLGTFLLVFRPGFLLRRGERLVLGNAAGWTVDTCEWGDDGGFVPGQLVYFPCHIARVASDVSVARHVAGFEVSNGDGRVEQRLLKPTHYSVPHSSVLSFSSTTKNLDPAPTTPEGGDDDEGVADVGAGRR